MASLRPFRDYDEKDVINLYAMDLATGTNADGAISLGTDWSGRLSHGHVVSVGGAGGWNAGQDLELLGEAGATSNAVQNVTTQRYGVEAKVRSAGGQLIPLGITLFHVAQYDENGEQLKFNPRKASELEACIVGQAVPVVTRGIFMLGADVDGGLAVDVGNQGDGNAVPLNQAWLDAGGDLYAGANGSITTGIADGNGSLVRIGKGLGLASGGNILIKLEL